MKTDVHIKLFADLRRFTPESPENYPISKGMTVQHLLEQLRVPLDQAKLIFINGIRGDLASVLRGKEKIGIFPPVGGG